MCHDCTRKYLVTVFNKDKMDFDIVDKREDLRKPIMTSDDVKEVIENL